MNPSPTCSWDGARGRTASLLSSYIVHGSWFMAREQWTISQWIMNATGRLSPSSTREWGSLVAFCRTSKVKTSLTATHYLETTYIMSWFFDVWLLICVTALLFFTKNSAISLKLFRHFSEASLHRLFVPLTVLDGVWLSTGHRKAVNSHICNSIHDTGTSVVARYGFANPVSFFIDQKEFTAKS